jgi:CBS-domain-containing membrane protein
MMNDAPDARLDLLRVGKLRIRTRCVVDPQGGHDVAVVECPRQHASVDVDECLSCAAYHGLSFERERGRSYVVCRQGGGAAPASSLASARVADVMSPEVVCVRANMTAADVIALFNARDLRSVPVVDAAGRPTGVISRSDLCGQHGASGSVDDHMSPVPFFVRSDAAVAVAAALMAHEGVHQIPVVADNGVVIGVLTSLDVMRWLARREGHLRSDP